jgi:hypothetical protein
MQGQSALQIRSLVHCRGGPCGVLPPSHKRSQKHRLSPTTLNVVLSFPLRRSSPCRLAP